MFDIVLSLFPTLFAVMGWDDALIIGGIAAAVGGTSAGISSWFGNRNSKKQISRDAALNYKYQLLMAKNGLSASVEGLRKAGLNPMLAANGGINAPTMPAVKSDMSNSGHVDMAGALDTAMAVRSNESTVDLQDTQSDLNKAQEKLTGIKAANELANGGLSGHYGALKRVLHDFGFSDKTADSLMPAFMRGKNVPNGSERLEGAIKSQHVPNSDVLDLPPVDSDIVSLYNERPSFKKDYRSMDKDELTKEVHRLRSEEFFRRQRSKIDYERDKKRKAEKSRLRTNKFYPL